MRNLTSQNKHCRKCEIKEEILALLLFIWCVAPCSQALAVPAQQGEFVILGRAENNELVEEKIVLRVEADDISQIQARLDSGTEVLVLDKKETGALTYYIVSTVGKDGGIIGWVSEDYIYEIVINPQL